MKMTVVYTITVISTLFIGSASAQSLFLSQHFAKAAIAGGFTDGEGADQEPDSSSKGTSLEDLKNAVPASTQNVDGASQRVVGQDMMESANSEEFTDEFFRDIDINTSGGFQRLFETAGYVTPVFESYGQIVDGANSGQIAFGLLENVYIDKGKADGLRLGDQFWVMHADETVVNHPKTGDPIGVKVIVDGAIEIVEIVDNTSKAKIFRSFDGIKRGFKILPYDDKIPPYTDPDKRIRQKNIIGYLISGRLENEAFGQGDVVYFNVGEVAGVEPGDVFNIIDNEMVILADGSPEAGLPKIKGQAKVISTRDISSTALIVKSENVMEIGDEVRFAMERLP